MRLAVKVVPGARRAAIVGWLGDALKVAVTAPPERGRANHAVAMLLADALTAEVILVQGPASPRKVFEVRGLDEGEARRRLDGAIAAGATRR